MKRLYSVYILILLSLSRASFAQHVVLDCSITNDNINGVQVRKYSNISIKADLICSDTVIGKKHVVLRFKLSEPTLLYFNDVPIYVHPNDSLKIFFIRYSTKKRDSLFATGKNAPYYNFSTKLIELSKNLNYFFSAGKYSKDDWDDYKGAIESNQRAKVAFIKNYVKEYGLDKQFCEAELQEIKYQNLACYLFPNYSFGFADRNRIQVPASFYSNISSNDFKRFIPGPSYLYALNLYNKYFTDSATNNIINRFSAIYLSKLYLMAHMKFTGLSRKALMLDIFREYTVFNMDSYRAEYGSFYNNLKKQYHDSATFKFIDSLNSLYDVINKPFPVSIMNSGLITLDGKRISIKKMLDDNKNSVIYIDFWASWCLPCKEEIPSSILLHEKLADKNIAFIYISIDSESLIDPWIKASHDFGILKNQYLLSGDINSPFAKYLSIYGIPKYIIIGGDGKLISKNALRPSNDKTLSMLIALAKKN